MTDKEAIDMMRRCEQELTGLRKQLDILTPKAIAFDSIVKILGLVPGANEGYSEDLVWTLRRRIKELEDDSNQNVGNAEASTGL